MPDEHLENTCSLADLRREIRCGFEALQNMLQHQQEALREVRAAQFGATAESIQFVADGELPCSELLPADKTYSHHGVYEGDKEELAGPSPDTSDLNTDDLPTQEITKRTTKKTNHHHQWIREHTGGDDSRGNSSYFRSAIASKWDMLRYKAREIVSYENRFDCFFGFLVVLNSACVGLEIQANLDGDSSLPLAYIEYTCLFFFVIELSFRSLANVHNYLCSGWFILDVILVGSGIVAAVVEFMKHTILGESAVAGAIDAFIVLRVLRLLRLVRAFRLLDIFQEAWKLSHGLLHSSKTVISACFLVILTIYVFACLGLEIIRGSDALNKDPITSQIVQVRFSSLLRTMLTLLSFANGDSIAALYEPMIDQSPLLIFFFGALWLFVSVSLMNLVTAVIVDTAITQSKEDAEVRRIDLRKKARKLLPDIKQLFNDLGGLDGILEYDEVDMTDVIVHPHLRDIIDEEKLKDLFQWLDIDRSGSVDKEEFVDGILHLAMQDIPIETTQTLQLMRSSLKAVTEVHDTVYEIHQQLLAMGTGSKA